MKRVDWGIRLSIVAVFVCAAPMALAQYTSDFEGLSASAGGTKLTDQDGYYIPEGTNSIDYLAYTYDGNGVGLPQNPVGGKQFIASTGPASPTFARAQRDMTYGNGTGKWTVAFDIAGTFVGELPTAQNLGSFSTQTFPGDQTFIALARWTDVNTAENWNADYVWFNADDGQLIEMVPDENFQNLDADHWYRWATTFDLDTNRILEVSITDLTTKETFTHNPADRYLDGGEDGGGSAPPGGFRFFAGGGVAGNVLGFDNPSITPEPASLVLLVFGGLALMRRR